MKARLLVAGFAVLMLCGAEGASAFITANTIDRQATYEQGGARVRATGPIGCTRGERITIRVTVTQAASGAQARAAWKRRCSGEIQHWQVRAGARRETRFENGMAKVCADGTTRRGSRVTDNRKWCQTVSLSAEF